MTDSEQAKFYYLAPLFCLLMVIIYLLEFLLPIKGLFAFKASEFSSRPWTIITAIFIHSQDDLTHLTNNLFFLGIFGTLLERIIGSRWFLYLFLLGGAIANLSAFYFYPQSFLLGASGAIATAVLTLAVLRPKAVGYALGAPMPMWLAAVVWFIINLALTAADTNIAGAAHLYGGIVGLITGIYFRVYRQGDLRVKLPSKDKSEEEDISETEMEAWERRWMERNRRGAESET